MTNSALGEGSEHNAKIIKKFQADHRRFLG